MKALFIQDIRYMLTQKSFLVTILIVGIALALGQNDNYIFVIGYLGFMGMITGLMSLTMGRPKPRPRFSFLAADRSSHLCA